MRITKWIGNKLTSACSWVILCFVFIYITSCNEKTLSDDASGLVTANLSAKIIAADSIAPPIVHQMPSPTVKKLVRPKPIYKNKKEQVDFSEVKVAFEYIGNKVIGSSNKNYPKSYLADVSPKLIKDPIRIPVNNKKNRVNGRTMVLDRDDGMPSFYSAGLCQDKEGAIWGCSRWGGAWKYDGSQVFHFNESVGLPDYSIVNMYVDSDGDVWFGMSTGLVRYDGYTFTNYSEYGSISAKKPTKIAEDPNGNIWIGSEEGIYHIDKASDQIIHLDSFNGLQRDAVSSILMDKKGRLWVTYNNLGLSIISIEKSGGKFDIDHYATKDSYFQNVQCIHQTQNGEILIGTNINLIVIKSSFAEAKSDAIEHGYLLSRDKTNFIYALAEDRDGHIYQGSQLGLHKIDITSDGKISGVNSMNHQLVKLNEVLALQVDQENDLWVANIAGNICRIDLDETTTPINDDYNVTGKLFDAAKDKLGNLWMISLFGDIFCLESKDLTGQQTMLDYTGQIDRANRRPYQIESDNDGNIHISNQTTVMKLNIGRSIDDIVIESYDLGEVTSITEIVELIIDRDNNIWVADNTMNVVDKSLTSRGGGAYKIEGNYVYQYGKSQGLAGDDTYSVCQDSEGSFWFNSTYKGITKYEPKTKDNPERWINYDGDLIQKSSFRVIPFFEDGVYFFSNQGLTQIPSKLDTPNQKIVLLKQSAKRQAQSIHAADLVSNNEGWKIVIDGVTKISQSENKDGHSIYNYEQFDRLDGLKLDNNIAIQELDSDERYLMTMENFYRLNTINLSSHSEIPPVRLHDVKLSDQNINWTSEIQINKVGQRQLTDPKYDRLEKWSGVPVGLSLHYTDNYLSFEYNSVNVSNPHKLQYRYYLKGYEDDWNNPTDNTKAQYPNLSHGNYTFYVQSRMPNSKWTEETNYEFRIRPPYWYTWWAYVLYSLLVCAVLGLIYKFMLARKMEKKEAQKLKEIDLLKSRLYTNITHEFRTPLTVISGMASQMKADPEQWFVSGVDMIQRNSTRLLGLVNQMLDLSKLESGKISIENEQGDIINYLKYIVESIHSFAESKEIQVHFHANEEVLVMDFDREKILQIITNLISNAVKFTPSNGNIFILVSSIRKDDQEYLQITVKDTGVGIAEDKLEFIFDRFYQVDDSSTRSVEGSGVGLAMVRELVLIMNGDITVKSIVGRETEFKIVLPITNLAQKTELKKVQKISSKLLQNRHLEDTKKIESKSQLEVSQPINPKGRPTLLLVEDNADVVAYIVSCLHQDYHILVGNNGQEGLDMALERIPDLIISDIMMPIMDGLELCQLLKVNLLTSHIPIIMLTAKVDMASKLDGLSIGADAYLAKPFHKEELLVRIKTLLASRLKLQQYYLSKSLGEAPSLDQAETIEDALIENEFILKIKEVLESNFDNYEFSVEKFQREMGMSKSQLFRKMNALIGMSPNKYIRHVRMSKAITMLTETDETIMAISLSVGYEDAGYFGRVFKKEFGISPNDWRVQQ